MSEPPAAASPLESAFQGVASAVRAQDIPTAARLSRQALDRGLEHPMFLNLRALDYEQAGMFKQALADLRRAHVLAPRDFAILNACGLALARMDRFDEALACYDQALALNPDFGPAWYNRAWVLEQLGELAKAIAGLERAVELNPENLQAWSNLGFLANRRGDEASARRYAEKALALRPGYPPAVLALANAEIGAPAKAEALLRESLAGDISRLDRAHALGLLADALDAQDQTSEAFTAYADSNALFAAEYAQRFSGDQATIAQVLPWMIGWARALDPADWRRVEPPASAAGEAGHVFLIGFPRSGTTLIESVLGSHPDVVTLEEREPLRAATLVFLDSARDLAALAQASEARIRALREDYWTAVSRYGAQVKGKIFIDKHPFNTLKLPVIRKLFPDAKILFAVRDPRDVVLSCFRRRFNINSSTYEYLDLAKTATNYDQMMTLAELIRAKLPFDEHQLVYERLVGDFTTEAKAACAYIGADWRDDLADFASRAHHGNVASASAAQIARGLYTDGAGQWRRYRDELAPVISTLRPWIARWGYDPD
jgi:tetratricopeptide (TPR) repeat protein